MKKNMKKSSSSREMRSSPTVENVSKYGVVYRQTSLQAIDDAPEPNEGTNIDRHAVSAFDLLSESVSNMTKDGSARSSNARSSNTQVRTRSQSFTLQGNASGLLVKGGTAPAVRRKTEMMSSTSSHSATTQDGAKRSIYGPKDLVQQVKIGLENLQLEEFSDDGTGMSNAGAGERRENGAALSDSSDSYDANVLGVGMEDGSGSQTNKPPRLQKQGSSLSGRHLTGSVMQGSVAELSNFSDEYDDDDDGLHGSVSSYDDDAPFKCCGVSAPDWRCIRLNRIASAVVRYAPCFWCFPIPVSATDRTVLTRLNIMSAFFALGQMVATSWLVIIMLIPPSDHEQDDEYGFTKGMEPNLWSLTGAMYSVGFFGTVIFITNLVTLKVIQVVNLVGAIRYLWVLLYLIPFQVFFVASLFDFYGVTHVWVKHWWRVPSMAWFRETYCEPGTAGTLCMVPGCGQEATSCNETEWCLVNYQATNCTAIRDAAQLEVEDLMNFYYNGNLAWGFILIAILLLIVNTLERIISRPMVQKSRESNVPAWLSLPFMGCSVVGAVFRYSPSSVLSVQAGSTYSWVGSAYMTCGVLFLITALLAWFISTFSILSSRDKRYKHVSVIVFIFFMAVTCFILTVVFVASTSYSAALVEIPISRPQKHEIACGVDTADSCSNCDGQYPLRPKCPEWSMDDVKAVLQTQTKGSATLAFIFFIYAFSALRFGFVLRKHVTMYQIEYV
ncbi:expressed unknown protein [Seminavis robusta]|uniref:Uncharacterized protein n=1 Tax=Seminavis robusta TaxID=568900 RepID=A0A9N8DUP3_9STRA|nr:expressed unknown protein [Seminavis robusta]|eukprot:Sro294_g110300.1 n/a (725) ;mRNA; r:63089-65689